MHWGTIKRFVIGMYMYVPSHYQPVLAAYGHAKLSLMLTKVFMNVEYLISDIIEKIDINIMLFSRAINKNDHYFLLY